MTVVFDVHSRHIGVCSNFVVSSNLKGQMAFSTSYTSEKYRICNQATSFVTTVSSSWSLPTFNQKPAQAPPRVAAMTGKDMPPAKARKPTKKSKKPGRVTEKPTLQEALQVQEEETQAHLRSAKTMVTYGGHIRRAHKWFGNYLQADMMVLGTTVLDDSDSPLPAEVKEMHNDPEFRKALERPPNKWSSVVARLYLSWMVFKDNLSLSSAQGARAALMMYWDES